MEWFEEHIRQKRARRIEEENRRRQAPVPKEDMYDLYDYNDIED